MNDLALDLEGFPTFERLEIEGFTKFLSLKALMQLDYSCIKVILESIHENFLECYIQLEHQY